jgi:hypothetical protein
MALILLPTVAAGVYIFGGGLGLLLVIVVVVLLLR